MHVAASGLENWYLSEERKALEKKECTCQIVPVLNGREWVGIPTGKERNGLQSDDLDGLTDACRLALAFVGELENMERICETGNSCG